MDERVLIYCWWIVTLQYCLGKPLDEWIEEVRTDAELRYIEAGGTFPDWSQQ